MSNSAYFVQSQPFESNSSYFNKRLLIFRILRIFSKNIKLANSDIGIRNEKFILKLTNILVSGT